MDDMLRRVLFDPTVARLVLLGIGLVAIRIALSVARRYLGRRIQDSGFRYRARKAVTLAAYVLAAVFIGLVFSERLGGFTVALGVAGAGIAFALQEVIASVAGWLAVSLGDFFRPGDRIQLGGIRGDVIDVGVLRTTLMECGQWVNSDQYMIEDAAVAPTVTLQANQSGIELTLRYVVDYKERRAIRDRLFTRILEEIDATQGRVGIAVSTLNIEKVAPLEVRLTDDLRARGTAGP